MSNTRPTSCREALGLLSEWLAPGNPHMSETERSHLWNVLTALRGPDSGNIEEKVATTSVIRAEALGEYTGAYYGTTAQDTPNSVNIRKQMQDCGRVSYARDHFVHHAASAFIALGLAWLKQNKEIKDAM